MENRNDYRQWIADVYHCSGCWGEKMTEDDMRVMLTESAREKDTDDYSPDPSMAAECAAYWNELCELYPAPGTRSGCIDTCDRINHTTEKVKEDPKMAKMISDGWHTIAGYRVLVENGKILRGIIGEGNNQRTAYPYRHDRRQSCMNECSGLSVDAFRAGVRRGTVTME